MATVQQTFAFLQASDPVVKDSAALARPPKPRDSVELPQPCDGVAGPAKPPANDRDAVLRRLRAEVGCVSTARSEPEATLSTGSHAIDAMLPSGGLKAAALAEWIAESDSSGAAALSLIAAAVHLRCQAAGGPLVIVDVDKTFYPPAAVALGVPMERIILVRPRRHAEMVWAIDQALRCEAVAAVWAQVGTRLDDRDARRFQLAAEIGHTPGFLVRPQAARGQPSFAEVRFHIEGLGHEKGVRTLLCEAPAGPYRQKGPDPFFEAPAGPYRQKGPDPFFDHDPFFDPDRLLQVTLDRCRGGVIGQNVWVQIDDQAHIHHVSSTESTHHETAAVHLASRLANPTTVQPAHRRRA